MNKIACSSCPSPEVCKATQLLLASQKVPLDKIYVISHWPFDNTYELAPSAATLNEVLYSLSTRGLLEASVMMRQMWDLKSDKSLFVLFSNPSGFVFYVPAPNNFIADLCDLVKVCDYAAKQFDKSDLQSSHVINELMTMTHADVTCEADDV